MSHPSNRGRWLVPATPAIAAHVFGPRIGVAEEYARLLAGTGIDHGLLGPRERPRVWERHILNCAVIAHGFTSEADVLDVGSGAGLPGVVLAIARPDLHVTLVEPLQRRTSWLQRTISDLRLENVSLRRGRAESLWGDVRGRYVTARAVARLSTVSMWCLPLLEPGGSLLVMKGATAEAELAVDRPEIECLGGRRMRVEAYGIGLVDPPSLVVRIEVDRAIQIQPSKSRIKPRSPSRRRHQPSNRRS
ncbi:MAG: 16S rRNA (guanine(527)-N(7))-methyltransferase RsmG [Dermatophilaceae bacterium]